MWSFLTVLGSTHFLIQLQTVGKYEGAPMTWDILSLQYCRRGREVDMIVYVPTRDRGSRDS